MRNVVWWEGWVAWSQDKGIAGDTLVGAPADALESAYKRMPDAH